MIIIEGFWFQLLDLSDEIGYFELASISLWEVSSVVDSSARQ